MEDFKFAVHLKSEWQEMVLPFTTLEEAEKEKNKALNEYGYEVKIYRLEEID